MEALLMQLLPLVFSKIIIPEVARVVRANPTITDDQIIAALPEALQALCGKNQTVLDSIRTAAGKA